MFDLNMDLLIVLKTRYLWVSFDIYIFLLDLVLDLLDLVNSLSKILQKGGLNVDVCSTSVSIPYYRIVHPAVAKIPVDLASFSEFELDPHQAGFPFVSIHHGGACG